MIKQGRPTMLQHRKVLADYVAASEKYSSLCDYCERNELSDNDYRALLRWSARNKFEIPFRRGCKRKSDAVRLDANIVLTCTAEMKKQFYDVIKENGLNAASVLRGKISEVILELEGE